MLSSGNDESCLLVQSDAEICIGGHCCVMLFIRSISIMSQGRDAICTAEIDERQIRVCDSTVGMSPNVDWACAGEFQVVAVFFSCRHDLKNVANVLLAR